eukprot:5198270-Amphidinium_carterae.1
MRPGTQEDAPCPLAHTLEDPCMTRVARHHMAWLYTCIAVGPEAADRMSCGSCARVCCARPSA